MSNLRAAAESALRYMESVGQNDMYSTEWDVALRLRAALSEPSAPTASNPDEVICPACCHQFRAIPENVQAELSALRAAAPIEAAHGIGEKT